MSMIPGARWWKVDFHTHTPASSDYGKGPNQATLRQISHADWLLGFMRAGIDAVVVTDHNSGAWIDPLKLALEELTRERPPGFRPLTLFPGVEITANGSAHILAVFPPSATTHDVTLLLGAVGATSAPGASDPAASASSIQVVQRVVSAGALPVLAHVDAEFNSALKVPGNTLGPLLDEPELHAMEVFKQTWTPPELYRQRRRGWAWVLGSDSHHPSNAPGERGPGSHFTWVKMESPTHDGLRLALLDGNDVSIRRSDVDAQDPNQHSHLVIEDIRVTDARYAGRGEPLVVPLSPWLTTVIGGRGTGKSTIVHLARMALRREDELHGELRAEFDAFATVPQARAKSGALTAATQVQVILRKDRQRYRIQWATSGALAAIEEADEAGGWRISEGEVRSRFPARIYSQGQIFAMATDGRALMNIIDEAQEVDRGSWNLDWNREVHRFSSLRAKVREIEQQLTEKAALEGSLSDVRRKLAVFEEGSHAEVLKAFQRAQRQQREFDAWTAGLAEHEAVLRSAADRLRPVEIDQGHFDPAIEAERPLVDEIEVGRAWVTDLARRTSSLADELRDRAESWRQLVTNSAWTTTTHDVAQQYRALVDGLAARGVSDIGQYGGLVQQRRLLEERLQALGALATTIAELRGDLDASLQHLATLRRALIDARARFLRETLAANAHVRMSIEPYGHDPRAADASLRSVLGLKDEEKFADDLLSADGQRGCLADLYRNLPADPAARTLELEQRVAHCRRTLTMLASGGDAPGGAWFKKHMRQLAPELVDRLQHWTPPDDLVVSYSPRGDGSGFRSLEQGSPGQKTAAILAFVLAHGTEPIILDQPEDDLDNELIYQLIVAQLRANKQRRQVVVVTHNPNIVVNGDAELILVMEAAAGQCKLTHQGSLQSRSLRAQVCKIMEGGREALEKRYRRILAGDDHV